MDKGQVSETINWVVATIIIVVVLLVCFFMTKGDFFESKLSLPDKQKDFIATKSIVNFVDANFELIDNSVVNENSDLLEKEVSKLSDVLPTVDEFSWGWRFVLRDSNKSRLTNTILDTGYTWKVYPHTVELFFDEPNHFEIIAGEQCKECTPMVNIAH